VSRSSDQKVKRALTAALVGSLLTAGLLVGGAFAAEPQTQPDIDSLIGAEVQPGSGETVSLPVPRHLGVLDPAVAAMWLEQARAIEHADVLPRMVPDAQWADWRQRQLAVEYPESFASEPAGTEEP
jgi:hypothetical protein